MSSKPDKTDKRELHKGSPLGSKKNRIESDQQPEEEFIQPKANKSKNKS
jgi:hypothetical protein